MPEYFELTLGLPHTNHRGLSEPLLLQQAGHLQWTSLATRIGVPLSSLRTPSGGEVYAAFYYIEERFPEAKPIESYGLDDRLRFALVQRAFKNIAFEGRIVFDHAGCMADTVEVESALAPHAEAGPYPFVHFGNIFITPVKGNSVLRVAQPSGGDFTQLPPLPNQENPYRLTQAAGEGMGLGVLDDTWTLAGSCEHVYEIDIDRDTNGAGLVYFANYVTFMETAERLAVARVVPGFDGVERRTLRHRRIGYYGNADVHDTITVRVEVLRHPAQARWLGFRYLIERQQDRQRICLSEAVKVVPPGS